LYGARAGRPAQMPRRHVVMRDGDMRAGRVETPLRQGFRRMGRPRADGTAAAL